MATTQRIYLRAGTGSGARKRLVSGLPEGYRRVLDCLHRPGSLAEILNRVPQYAGCALADWLARLEKMGLVECVTLEWIEQLIALGCYEHEPARTPWRTSSAITL